jgi:hypothetical protein
VGWVFEAIIHRILSGAWQLDGPTLQPIRMVSDCGDPPVFSTDPSSPSSSIADTLTSLASLRTGTRAVTRVNFTHGLSNVTLGNDKYYIPTTTTNPLFDSFTIDLDLDRHTVVISVFQIATSRREGSTRGYTLIRKIMARVCELLKKADFNAIVTAAYVRSPRMDPSTSGRCPLTGTRTPKPMTMAGMSSAFPSWYSRSHVVCN